VSNVMVVTNPMLHWAIQAPDRPDEDLVLGSGRRLFADGGPLATLGLVDSMTTTPTNLSWMLWTAIGIGGIWIAVLLLSLLARNLTSGSNRTTSPSPRSPPAGDGDRDRPRHRSLCRHLRADRRGDADGAGGRPRHRVPRRAGGG
jgi:hypothetical protein